MSVADLANVPQTQEEMLIYSALHMAHHIDVNAAILSLHNITLPAFPLDPITPDDPAWGYLHQEMHNNNDAILGVSGFDLIEVNWRDPQQRAAWAWLNFQLHYQEAQATGAW